MNSSPSSSRMILDIASAISSCFIPLDSNSAQDSSIVLRSFSFENMQIFAKLSNDYNPIHVDIDFAKSKGFDAPLIYGLLLSSQMSGLIGQELPDKNAILTGIQMDFIQPSFPDDQLIFGANLINKSDATYNLEFNCHISRDNKKTYHFI